MAKQLGSDSLQEFALNGLHEAALLFDEGARLCYVNEEACRILGYDRQALLRCRLEDIAPDFAAEGWPAHWRELKRRRPLASERHLRTRDGRLVPVEVSENFCEYAGAGYNLALARDVGERQAAAAALQEQYRHAQSLLRLSRVLESAQSYDEVLRITQAEVQATVGYPTVWVYLFSEDLQYAYPVAAGGASSDTIMTDDSTARLTIPGDPMMEEIATATDLVVVEDARTDPRTNKAIVEHLGNRSIINVPILFFDRHVGAIGMGTFGEEGIRVPTAAERAYLAAMGSHLAVTLDRLHLLVERRRIDKELRQYREHLEDTVQQRTAELLLARDAAEAANKAKSVFLANMSHELRTPLNAILGFSRMMGHDALLSGNQRANLDIINRSGEHLLRLINDVLEMAKIEAGRLQLEVAPFDLGNTVRDVVEMMQLRCEEKGLRLLLDQSSEFPRYIKGDEARLRQVLLNLLSNAVKFTDQGGVTVRLGTRANSRQHLLIEVQDSGPGIAPEDRERLFKPFVQLTEESSRQGTGLGLAITRQFVQMMGGQITVDSQLGKGSLFRIDLPVETVAAADILKPETRGAGEVVGLVPGQPAYRILIAEDQHDNQLLLQRLMTNIGLDTRVVDNGEECVAMYRQWQPDFIWMDRRMPVLDGVEATRRIRRLPGGEKVKIVAVTASAFLEEQKMLLDVGMDDFVRKPYRFNEMYDCLARHLGLQYLYSDSPGKAETPVTLSADSLRAVPPVLREELRLALEALDSTRIAALIGRIGQSDAPLAQALSHLADEFDYPAILDALAAIGRDGREAVPAERPHERT